MNKQTITFTASEQTLTKTGGIEHYASNTVSYIEASFTLGDNWAGYDSIRAVWESGYARIATVLDANNKCIVPAEVLTYKSKVNVNLVGSIVENTVLTDRLTTYPILALTVDADARVDSSETTPVTASQFEQFVDVVRDEASAIQNYTYDSEAWAVGQRAGVDVPSTDETYQNNAKYYADQGATLQQEVSDLKSDIGNTDLTQFFELGNISIGNTGWTYSTSTSRVRTIRNTSLFIRGGTKIGLTDYSNARYYIGWKDTNGAYHNRGWLTADFTTIEDGDYCILISNITETTQSDKNDLASLFFGFQANVFDHITANEDDIREISKVSYSVESGYITDGGSIHEPTAYSEVYTNKISCKNGSKFDVEMEWPTYQGLFLAYALYDEFGNFISRTIIQNVESFPATIFKASITVNNTNARYIAFTYRTYGNVSFSLSTKDIARIPIYSLELATDILNCDKYAINENVKSINHRGFNTIAPENTIPAFKLSRQNGFKYVETDIAFTSDDVAVLLHDATINRTARNADGSTIASEINIADITYAQALTYDFGIWKGSKYAGTKIPTFESFIQLCRKIGLCPYIEIKSGAWSESQIDILLNIVKVNGMSGKCTWISFSYDALAYIKEQDPKARLGYVQNEILDWVITAAIALKTQQNEVFIDAAWSNLLTDEAIDLAIEADIPVETWTINADVSIANMNPYITGATSDSFIAGYSLFKQFIK